MDLNRNQDKKDHAALRSLSGSLDETQRALTELKRGLVNVRTRIGTGEEEGGKGFFKVIETIIDLTSATISQGQNQLKQVDICVSYIGSFNGKNSSQDEVIHNLEDQLKSLEERIAVFEKERLDQQAVKGFFNGASTRIIKIAATIAAIPVITGAIVYLISVVK